MTLKNREFELDNTEHIKVAAEVSTVVHILDRSQISGDGDTMSPSSVTADIHYNLSYDNKVKSSTDVTNKDIVGIVDPSYSSGDRFTLITEICSILNKRSMHLYHDAKYNDFIFVPHFDKVTSAVINIKIPVIRGPINGMFRNTEINTSTPLPGIVLTDAIDSKTHVFMDRKVDRDAVYKNSGVMLDNKYYTESALNNVLEYVSLGSSTDIFASSPNVISITESPIEGMCVDIVRKDVDDVLFLLPF